MDNVDHPVDHRRDGIYMLALGIRMNKRGADLVLTSAALQFQISPDSFGSKMHNAGKRIERVQAAWRRQTVAHSNRSGEEVDGINHRDTEAQRGGAAKESQKAKRKRQK